LKDDFHFFRVSSNVLVVYIAVVMAAFEIRAKKKESLLSSMLVWSSDGKYWEEN